MLTLGIRLSLSTAIFVSGLSGIAVGPAAAVENKVACGVGAWELRHKTTVSRSSAEDWVKRSGATGARLTITKTYAIYSFTGSKPEYSIGAFNGEDTASSTTYKRKLKVKIRLDNSVRGHVEFDGKTASGDATFQEVVTKPDPRTYPVESLVTWLRKGHAHSMTPEIGRFTCSKKWLVIREAYDMLGYKFTNTLTFRRIK